MISLESTARKLGSRARHTRRGKEIPWLWFFTDPVRTPDPATVAARLPKGAAVVYRAFGAKDAEAMAKRLRAATRERGVRLLIGADDRLAMRVGADGVHLPERLSHRILRLKQRRPEWLVSVAAHSHIAIHKARGADAIVVSAVFPSRSRSASLALGPLRFAQLVRTSRAPVIALGGVNNKNAPRLISTGAAGLAAIDGLSGPD